jgi:hypothetical protein
MNRRPIKTPEPDQEHVYDVSALRLARDELQKPGGGDQDELLLLLQEALLSPRQNAAIAVRDRRYVASKRGKVSS